MNTIMLLAPTVILLLLAISGISIKKEKDVYIDTETNSGLRGLCALCIVFHHSAQMLGVWEMFLLEHFGYLVMNIFFMLSGYGLMYNFLSKERYLQKVFPRKLIRLFFLFCLMNLMMCICNIYIRKRSLSARQIWNTVMGRDMINQASWFLWVLILLYIIFYVAAKWASRRRIISATVAMLALLGLAFQITGKPLWYYNYIGSFAIGIHMMLQEEKRVRTLRYRGNAYICVLAVLSVLFYVVSKLGRFMVLPTYADPLLHIAAIACSVCLALFAAEVLKKICFHSRICAWLGRRSLWIYMLHGVVQDGVTTYVPKGWPCLWISLGITLLLADVLEKGTGKVKKYA